MYSPESLTAGKLLAPRLLVDEDLSTGIPHDFLHQCIGHLDEELLTEVSTLCHWRQRPSSLEVEEKEEREELH